MTEPAADVVIRTTNPSGGACMAAMLSVQNCPEHVAHPILVIDGATETSSVTLQSNCWLVARSSGKRRGAVWATNAGLALALTFDEPDWVVLLDDDVAAPAGDSTWLRRWLDETHGRPQCAAWGAMLSRSAWAQNIRNFPPGYQRNWAGGVAGGPPVNAFVSAAVLLRKSAVRACGLWDMRYSPGQWEDTDYSMALRRAGYEIRVARSVYFEHGEHASFEPEKFNELLETNRIKFVEKWGVGAAWDAGIIKDRDIAQVIAAKHGRTAQ